MLYWLSLKTCWNISLESIVRIDSLSQKVYSCARCFICPWRLTLHPLESRLRRMTHMDCIDFFAYSFWSILLLGDTHKRLQEEKRVSLRYLFLPALLLPAHSSTKIWLHPSTKVSAQVGYPSIQLQGLLTTASSVPSRKVFPLLSSKNHAASPQWGQVCCPPFALWVGCWTPEDRMTTILPQLRQVFLPPLGDGSVVSPSPHQSSLPQA